MAMATACVSQHDEHYGDCCSCGAKGKRQSYPDRPRGPLSCTRRKISHDACRPSFTCHGCTAMTKVRKMVPTPGRQHPFHPRRGIPLLLDVDLFYRNVALRDLRAAIDAGAEREATRRLIFCVPSPVAQSAGSHAADRQGVSGSHTSAGHSLDENRCNSVECRGRAHGGLPHAKRQAVVHSSHEFRRYVHSPLLQVLSLTRDQSAPECWHECDLLEEGEGE